MTGAVQYRVSWEMPSAIMVAAYDWEAIYGPDVWPKLTDEQWDALPWAPSENVTGDHDAAHDQFTQLTTWADSHQQPIRNVKIEQRPFDGWSEVAV